MEQAEEGKNNSLFDESDSTEHEKPSKPELTSAIDFLTPEQLLNLDVFQPIEVADLEKDEFDDFVKN